MDKPPVTELRTARLFLRSIRLEDVDDFIRIWTDPVVTATLGGPKPPEKIRLFVEKIMSDWDTRGFCWWTIRLPDPDTFIGYGGLRCIVVEGKEEVEVGYGLLAEYWNKGYATELTRESVRVAFEALKLPEIVSFTLPTNLASRRVMEKAGFRYERDVTYANLSHVLYRQTCAS
jgi:ribosomal-protein-alanine N-acetyltransferase